MNSIVYIYIQVRGRAVFAEKSLQCFLLLTKNLDKWGLVVLGHLCFVHCQLLVLGYVGIGTHRYAEGPYFGRLHRIAHKLLLQPFNVNAVSAKCLGIIELRRTTTRCDSWWCRQAFLVEAAVTTMLLGWQQGQRSTIVIIITYNFLPNTPSKYYIISWWDILWRMLYNILWKCLMIINTICYNKLISYL